DDLNDMLFEQYELTRPEAETLGIVIENMAEAKKRLHEIKVAIRALGSINVGAIEEYKEVSERYEFLKEQIGDIEKSKSELQNIIEDLTSSMSEKFLTQFKKSMRSSRFRSPISSAAARASLFSRNPTIALNPLL
ncbi:MAG: chromosome segregation protein SMC, partial [Eubacterium sp.]